MSAKNYKLKSSNSHPVNFTVSQKAFTNFNSKDVKQELNQIKKEVKTIMDGAIIDPRKLSLNFTI